MYTYIITYRFETENGEKRPIYNAFIDWVKQNGECDKTTSTAYYESIYNYKKIIKDIRSLYRKEKDSIRTNDYFTIIEFNSNNELSTIIRIVDKKEHKCNSILKLINGETTIHYF